MNFAKSTKSNNDIIFISENISRVFKKNGLDLDFLSCLRARTLVLHSGS